jgi:hypothetical protein
MKPLVPVSFDVPQALEHPAFRLRMLQATDAQSDYEAVMESQARLRAGSPRGWPRPGFTLAENLADLTRHEAEFRSRIASPGTRQSSGAGSHSPTLWSPRAEIGCSAASI